MDDNSPCQAQVIQSVMDMLVVVSDMHKIDAQYMETQAEIAERFGIVGMGIPSAISSIGKLESSIMRESCCMTNYMRCCCNM
ncbi:hypothetical protein AGMMS49992_05140 [Clostridia bacterium]|nr:hypothetical protein AGMMS49992_05140 [Clostridia bacterium]